MSTLFDSAVQGRRKRTPWALVSLASFIRDVAWCENPQPGQENGVTLRAYYRPDVASRIWYELSWTGADGKRHEAAAQDFGLMLWRAAEIEMRARAERDAKARRVSMWREPDSTWWVEFRGSVHGPFQTHDEADGALDEMLRAEAEVVIDA